MTVDVVTLGSYPELPKNREATFLKIVGGGPVVSIALNGHDLGVTYTRYNIESTSSTWTFCHEEIATVRVFFFTFCIFTLILSLPTNLPVHIIEQY